jgi:heme exporter protein A
VQDSRIVATTGASRAPLVELKLEAVSKSFGSRRVLRNICAEVRSGEALVVTGHNGSGKSTLLTLIAGLARPDAGSIRFYRDGTELPLEDRRSYLSLVAPDLTLYPELTALENLEFFARVRSLPWSAAEGRELLTRVGLAGRGDDLAGTFSSGMRVRLKYAVALQSEPAVLLLDEPTAMLDTGGVEVVEQVIAEQRRRGVLVLATNDPQETRHGDLFLHLG